MLALLKRWWIVVEVLSVISPVNRIMEQWILILQRTFHGCLLHSSLSPYVNSTGPPNNPMSLEFLDGLMLKEIRLKAEIVAGGVGFEVQSASQVSDSILPLFPCQPSIDNYCYHHHHHYLSIHFISAFCI